MRTGTAKLYIPAEALTRKISSYDLGMVFNQNNKTMVNSDLKNVVPVQGAFAGGTSFNALY